MAISTTTSRAQYSGNGSTTSFSVPFKFNDNSWIVAELEDSSNVITTWVLDTDFTLAGAGVDAGGTLIATTAPASGESLTIYRQTPLTQSTDLVLTGEFNSGNVEDALDKLTAAIQDNVNGTSSGATDTYLKYPNSEPTTTSNVLPSNANRIDKYLAFDSAGEPTAVSLANAGQGNVIGPSTTTQDNVPQWDAVSQTLKDGKGLLTSTDTTVDSDANIGTIGHIINKLTELAAVTSLPALPQAKTVNLFEAGTVSWDRDDGHNATISIAGTVSLGLTNTVPGAYNLYVKKVSTAAVLNFTSDFLWVDGVKPSLGGVSINKSAVFSFMSPFGVSLFGAAISNIG